MAEESDIDEAVIRVVFGFLVLDSYIEFIFTSLLILKTLVEDAINLAIIVWEDGLYFLRVFL